MTDTVSLLERLTITATASLREAMSAIDRGARQIALVVDAEQRLIGTVTDGDLRRGLLRGLGMDDLAVKVMQRDFSAICENEGRESAYRLMQKRSFHQLPVVDEHGRLIDLIHLDDLAGLTRRDTRIVLMAGGLGTRLRPLTETVPKPLLPIGGKPILELILTSLVKQGFYDFTMTLNYRGDMIRDHFGDGAAYGAQIDYVEEDKRMGTAGALSLLPERPSSPFVVMNGDLLTSLSFDALLRFHAETNAKATMCAREFSMQVPYGVIELEDTALRRIIEKPSYNHFINAGIYVLSPQTLDYVVPGEWLDMPTLFERLIAEGHNASVFPLQEYWIDIGRMEDLERAKAEFPDRFQ